VRNTFLVGDDIRDDKRLARVHKTLRGFCDHLQLSAFECQLRPTDLVKCRHETRPSTRWVLSSGASATRCALPATRHLITLA
jgi:hypothetical protein